MRRDGIDYWAVPRLWPGATAFVVGGGPSLAGFDWRALAGRKVVAINAAFLDLPSAPVMCFTDFSFWEANRERLSWFPGHVCTVSRAAKDRAPARIRLIEGVTSHTGFEIDPGQVRRGRSTGHLAIGLAVALGAARIVLLGFDMRNVDGRSNYHDRYRTAGGAVAETADSLYAREFIAGFNGWRQQADRIGVLIVNATPGSALQEFPRTELGAELAEAAAAA
ncbi:MAG: hypothetical protein AB7O45_10590 [Alphaproteobacteria bacterium]